MRKKLEHGFKATVHDGAAVSVCNPRAYARRFLAYMEGSVFPAAAASGGGD